MTPTLAASILQIQKPWTFEKIKKAFRRGSLRTHPDRKGGTEEAFKRLGAAKEILEEHLDEVAKRQKRGAPGSYPWLSPEDVLKPMRSNTKARSRRRDWNSSWYDTGDARSRAAGQSEYFKGRRRVDPETAQEEERGRDNGAAEVGDWFTVRAFVIGKRQIRPTKVRAQVQIMEPQKVVIAIYLSEPIESDGENIQVILASGPGDEGCLYKKPIIARSHNSAGLLTTIWFDPINS